GDAENAGASRVSRRRPRARSFVVLRIHSSVRHMMMTLRFRFGRLALFVAAAGLSACASAPLPPPKAPTVQFDRKMAWILQLEDQRILRLELPPPPPAPVVPTRGKRVATPPPPPPPDSSPDLAILVKDSEARVRRRAALAIGRVGLPEGVAPLTATLSDPDA